jgi:hypothetical protein
MTPLSQRGFVCTEDIYHNSIIMKSLMPLSKQTNQLKLYQEN